MADPGPLHVPGWVMPDVTDPNTSSPSTTWGWRRVKIGRPPEAEKPSGAQRRTTHGLLRRDPRKPLTVTVVYRGGSECWWELRARGVVLRRPGHNCLHDVLAEFTGKATR